MNRHDQTFAACSMMRRKIVSSTHFFYPVKSAQRQMANIHHEESAERCDAER
jgi:hypothetical protein